MRDAVYDATPAARRRALHLEAADVPGLLPAEVAGHLLHARPLADLDRVVAATEEAARAAHDAQAWEDATRLYRLALELAPADDAARPRLLRGAGAALLDAADLEAARVLYREAADLARRAGDARGLAEAALGFAAGLGGFEVRLVDREQNELLDEALAALGDDEPALRVHLMARLAVGLAFTEDADRIPQLSAGAVALARATGDARALGAALAAHCDAIAGPDHVDVRTAEATEIVDLGRSLGDLGLELLGLRLRVVAHWEPARCSRPTPTSVSSAGWPSGSASRSTPGTCRSGGVRPPTWPATSPWSPGAPRRCGPTRARPTAATPSCWGWSSGPGASSSAAPPPSR